MAAREDGRCRQTSRKYAAKASIPFGGFRLPGEDQAEPEGHRRSGGGFEEGRCQRAAILAGGLGARGVLPADQAAREGGSGDPESHSTRSEERSSLGGPGVN